MFTPEALEALQQADAIGAASMQFQSATDSGVYALALPNSMTLHDIEQYHPTRRRARGTVTTASLPSFAAYINTHKEYGASIFVNGDNLTATAILNLGTPTEPGHADNTVKLAPEQTAAYKAVAAASGGRNLSQRDLAEFMEEWADHIQASANLGGEPINLPHAIAAVRDLSIEAMRRQNTQDQQLSATRSTLESVTARGNAGTLPGVITFTVKPYSFLPAHAIALRVGVLTSEAKPTFALRAIKLDEHRQQMAEELATAIKDKNTTLPVHVGTYVRGA
jgi:uncharacterized protein YfdQ (DUF2303 family)